MPCVCLYMKEEGNMKKKRQRGEESQESQKSPNRVDSKKVKIQEDQSNKTQVITQQNAATIIKAVKPIITMISLVETRKVCSKLTLTKKPIFKVINNSSTQISCEFIADKKLIIETLKRNLVNHYTFTEPSEKPLCLVLKGFYDTNPADLLNILKEHQVPAIKTSVLFNSKHHTLYLVHFEAGSTTTASLMHSHRIIDDISVKWEPVKSKNKSPTQCHKCQRFGHTTTNCGFQYRSVKCLESHPIGECSRKSREGNPQCCNCRGDHAANHRGCKAYIAYEKRVKSRKSIKNHPASIVQKRLQPEDFPELSTQQPATSMQTSIASQPHCNAPTYSEKLMSQSQVSAPPSRESNSVAFDFVDLSSQLKDIPNIQSTLKLLQVVINQLKSIDNDKDRVLYILQVCSNFNLPENGL